MELDPKVLGKELADISHDYITRAHKRDVKVGDIFKLDTQNADAARGYRIRKALKQEFYDVFSVVYENIYWAYIDRNGIPYSAKDHREFYSKIWDNINIKRKLPPFHVILSMWKTIRATISSAYIVLHNNTDFLAVVVRGRAGMMNLPGGKMELSDNNDLFETARRETREELGLDIATYNNVYQLNVGKRIVAVYEIVYEQLPKYMLYSDELDGYLYIPWTMLDQEMVRSKFGKDKLKLLNAVRPQII